MLALSYYNAESEGQGFTCEPSDTGAYRLVTASRRFTTFREAENHFASICTPEVLSNLLQPLSEGAGRLYYAPTKLVPAGDGWRLATNNPPF